MYINATVSECPVNIGHLFCRMNGGFMLKSEKRYIIVWRILYAIAQGWFRLIFKFKREKYNLETPALIISNHVTNYDPILLALSFPKNNIHFVASEHLFRLGWVSKLIIWLVAPIARKKGSNGMDTAMATARTLRAGRSVCIFGEGETTWNGKTNSIVPSTGSLARMCGANLITYRLEGGYLTAPRWGKGIRRGQMRGHIVNTYTPEQLKAMRPDEITNMINRDIYEDSWAEQKKNPIRYRGRNRARRIEAALFACPECKGIGTVFGKGNHVRCSCGLDVVYSEYGTFDPQKPFANMAEWDEWQHKLLVDGEYDRKNTDFAVQNVTLTEVTTDHGEKVLEKGTMKLCGEEIAVGTQRFPMREIANMALIQTRTIVFSRQGTYYEIKAEGNCCLRTYLAVWQNLNGSK